MAECPTVGESGMGGTEVETKSKDTNTSECCLLMQLGIQPNLTHESSHSAIGFWTFSQTSDISDWQSHLLFVSAQHQSSPGAVCSAPSCSHCTPVIALPDMKRMMLYIL